MLRFGDRIVDADNIRLEEETMAPHFDRVRETLKDFEKERSELLGALKIIYENWQNGRSVANLEPQLTLMQLALLAEACSAKEPIVRG